MLLPERSSWHRYPASASPGKPYGCRRSRRTSSPPRQAVCHAGLPLDDASRCTEMREVRLTVAEVEFHRCRHRLPLQTRRSCVPVSHLLADSDHPATGRHKRRCSNFGFEERGLERPKPFNLDSDHACEGQTKNNRRSKEMVGRRFRRLDSFDRDGIVSGGSSLERRQVDTSQEDQDRDGHCDDELGADGKDAGAVCLPVERSRKKPKLVDCQEHLHDWTQEHLHEPRKVEKRRSLEELHVTAAPPCLAWSGKSKRRTRVRTSTAEYMDDATVPQEESQRSLDVFKQDSVPKKDISQNSASSRMDISTNSQPQLGDADILLVQCDFAGQQPVKQVLDERQAIEATHCVPLVDVNSKGANCTTAHQSVAESSGMSKLFPDIEAPAGLEKDKGTKVLGKDKEMEPGNVLKANGKLGSSNMEDWKLVVDASLDAIEVQLKLAEGRKCGLCGGGSDGEPPESLLPETAKQGGQGVSGSDRPYPGYSEWDAFGNEPGWLGQLLGPLNDRFGIAGVWVHQECAIWSPEVYFAGIGHIKNLRAALRRGRLLKCSRCSKPGATIGCRIERCPRTYHLPCARFEGCFFDHKKFLMACDEHLHLFLPRLPGHRRRRNSLNLERIRLKRKVGEWKKMAQRAAQLDLEAEEKWQEKAGVDEEFLKRERRRLQRDLARVAPIMIGGDSGKQNEEGWESIAGLENVVKCLKEMVMLPLLYPEAFKSLGVSPPRGVLLHGHPGTGKTLAVRALVGACAKGHKQVAYFARKGADCLGKYVGDAERQLRLLFYLAEKHQPSIIFFDEIDGLAPARSQHQDQTQKSVVSTLLALIDGIKSRGSVIVIGATNRPDTLDPALRRPGRFDREIYFPLPSITDRAAILALLTKKWQNPPSNDIVAMLAGHTTGFAGADLQALCAQAAMNSLKRAIPINGLLIKMENQASDVLPPLPELRVNVIDWATALVQVSPPCSWRSGKTLMNRVTTWPVSAHLLPALLWSMVKIILSLHSDARVKLPPMLEQMAVSLKATLESNLGHPLPRTFWNCTGYEQQHQQLEGDIENILSVAGMVAGHKAKQDMTQLPFEGSKFRVMISGTPMNGQCQLAAWILHGFEGFLEMFNLSLATMLQEGGGDAVQGLVQILGNVRSKCPCVIYMPQIETWAFESREGLPLEERFRVSECWSIFMQQINSMPVHLHIAFVASCELLKDEIPLEINSFFAGAPLKPTKCASKSTCHVQEALADARMNIEQVLSSSRSVPGSWVDLSLVCDPKVMFSRAADHYAVWFAERILDFLNSQEEFSVSKTSSCLVIEIASEDQQQLARGVNVSKDNNGQEGCEEKVSGNVFSHNVNGDDIESHALTSKTSRVLESELADRKNLLTLLKQGSGKQWIPEQKYLLSAISVLGYQLLYHPQLRELRHATSKLKTGPSFLAKPSSKSRSTDASTSQTDQVESVTLKGLAAIGLLAYTGMYVRPREVAEGVRKVLELLMSCIDSKVNLGKDPEQFSRLLQQAASLEDKVFAWAHEMQRFERISNVSECTCKDDSSSRYNNGDDQVEPADATVPLVEAQIFPFQDTPPDSLTESTCDRPAVDAVDPSVPHNCEDLIKPLITVSNEQHQLHCNSVAAEVSGDYKVQEAKLPQEEVVVNSQAESSNVNSSASWKHCPECLHLVKIAMKKLYAKAWRQRGSPDSLNVVDDVIGACSAAVSVVFNDILENCRAEGSFPCSGFQNQSTCECRSRHEVGTYVANSMARFIASKEWKPVSNLVPNSSNMKDSDTPNFTCLCLVLQAVSSLP